MASSTQLNHLNRMPVEIQHAIINCLEVGDIEAATQASKVCRELFNDSATWAQIAGKLNLAPVHATRKLDVVAYYHRNNRFLLNALRRTLNQLPRDSQELKAVFGERNPLLKRRAICQVLKNNSKGVYTQVKLAQGALHARVRLDDQDFHELVNLEVTHIINRHFGSEEGKSDEDAINNFTGFVRAHIEAENHTPYVLARLLNRQLSKNLEEPQKKN